MKFLKIAFLFLCISGLAQTDTTTKLGTIDIDFILSKMPELEGVQKDVDAYGQTLQVEFNKNYKAYETAINAFKDEQASLTINQRKARQDSIRVMESDLNKYNENAGKLITIKREELLQPLYEKIGVEIEKIAEAQGYTQIMQRNINLIYVDNRFDITLAVIKSLGIVLKEGE